MTSPFSSPYTTGTAVTKTQLDQLGTYINNLGLYSGGWVPLTGMYASGYVANNTLSGGFGYTPAYKLFANGEVKLRGVIGKATGNFPTGGAFTIATLPAGCIPAAQVYTDQAAGPAPNFLLRVMIGSDGTIQPYVPGSTTFTWLSLDNIQFEIA